MVYSIHMFLKKTYKLEDNLLVSGSTRGSTTWLAEALNANNEFRIIFEPFTPWQVPEWAVTGEQKRYLAPRDKTVHKELIERMLLGNVHNKWVDRLKKSKRYSSKVLIKCTRASAMLGWIQQNFPEIKIIIIVRDPFSVAYSNAERNWKDASSDIYLMQPRLVKEVFTQKQTRLLRGARGLFQKSMGMWTVETYLALKNTERNSQITSVFYENLVRNPDKELDRLLSFYGSRFDKKTLKRATQKSAMAGKHSITDASSDRFGKKWEGKITDEDIDFAHKLLEAFGLNKLYIDRNKPGFDQPLDIHL